MIVGSKRIYYHQDYSSMSYDEIRADVILTAKAGIERLGLTPLQGDLKTIFFRDRELVSDDGSLRKFKKHLKTGYHFNVIFKQ